jgi:hypothetical protein
MWGPAGPLAAAAVPIANALAATAPIAAKTSTRLQPNRRTNPFPISLSTEKSTQMEAGYPRLAKA